MSPPPVQVEGFRQRHTLIYPRPDAWAALLARRAELERIDLVRVWASRGWPLIVRRASAWEPGTITVGLPLPPSHGKMRIALTMESEEVAQVASLPLLTDVMGVAPREWRRHIASMVHACAQREVKVSVFGSLAWEYLTGLQYMTASSDLDMTWSSPRRVDLEVLLSTIAGIDQNAPMRLDGEIILADGSGVNWRELHSNSPEAVLKTSGGLTVVSRWHIEQTLR